jgi:hypothetical protein
MGLARGMKGRERRTYLYVALPHIHCVGEGMFVSSTKSASAVLATPAGREKLK